MDEVLALIDECVKICQGQRALARRIGTTGGRVSEWRSGARQVTPEALAQLCELAQIDGERARRMLAQIECENPKHAASREVMRRAFFGCLVLGAGILLGGSIEPAYQVAVVDLYIVLCLLCCFAGWYSPPPVRPFGCVPSGAAAPAP